MQYWASVFSQRLATSCPRRPQVVLSPTKGWQGRAEGWHLAHGAPSVFLQVYDG